MAWRSERNSAVRLPKKLREVRDVRSDPRTSGHPRAASLKATFPFPSELNDLSLRKKEKLKWETILRRAKGSRAAAGRTSPAVAKVVVVRAAKVAVKAIPVAAVVAKAGRPPAVARAERAAVRAAAVQTVIPAKYDARLSGPLSSEGGLFIAEEDLG